MSYLAYRFTVEPPQPGSEILVAMISELGFESFDYSDTGFTAYIKEEEATTLDFSEFQFEDFVFAFTVEKIAATNWNAEWEKNFEPVFVDDLLCIRAPFHEKNATVKQEIVIMPKMSFGTGHHQTTRLMCRELFSTEVKNKRVLDMGCGTGILAILAKQLGAGDTVGIDIDEWSVENAKENCSANGFPDILLKQGDVDLLDNEKSFEIILANINKNILKAQIPSYSKIMDKDALLFLSGFFTTDVEELTQVAKANGFDFVRTVNENEWAMMQLKKV
ncbi:50S ribosomal protein L11 methyltransferase [Sphingobacteriaceae bacterium]|nr:50S ribosomal protein L11 methyltransferase [Sphingobacteriaceae bacterium]